MPTQTRTATVIVGEVVGLHQKLSWFEKLPLFGKRIVVTRAQDQAGELSERLRSLGADAIEWPVIFIQPPQHPAPLDPPIAHLAQNHSLIFTPPNNLPFFPEP